MTAHTSNYSAYRKKPFILPILVACTMLSGCASTLPSYSTIKNNVAQRLGLEAPVKMNAALSAANDDVSMSHWWQRLGDEALNEAVETLLKQNLSLEQAAERVIQAREMVTSANARLLPSLGADARATRNRIFFEAGDFSATSYTTRYNTGLNASWELDLFGKLAKQREGAKARLDARRYEHVALAHSLIVTLIDLRTSISAQRQSVDVLQKIADNRKHAHKLTQRRYRAGSSRIKADDVYRDKKEYNQALSRLYDAKRELSRSVNAYDVLLGAKPGTGLAGANDGSNDLKLTQKPPAPPVCVSVSLLDRRPDVKAAMMGLKAVRADASVALRDLYPSLSLGGNAGFAGNSTNSLLSADQLVGSILANINARLFEGGALRANVRQQNSRTREAASAYAQALLEALQDGEDAMQAEVQYAQKLRSARKAFKADQSSARLVRGRYENGITNLRDLLAAKNLKLNSQLSYIEAQQQYWSAYTTLNLALGGDWTGQHKETLGLKADEARESCVKSAQSIVKAEKK